MFYIVRFVDEGVESLIRDHPEALAFLFDDAKEAERFRDHVRDTYGISADIGLTEINTLDRAVTALAEAMA